MSSRRYDTVAPQSERLTTWHNPTDHDMRVDVWYGNNGHYNEPKPTRLTFPAHQDVTHPSRFDNAIQLVQCTEEDCRRATPSWCTRGHIGTVIGGAAPQLQHRGWETILPDHLDPARAERKEKEAELAAASIAARRAEDAMLIAEARKREIDDARAKSVTSQPSQTVKK